MEPERGGERVRPLRLLSNRIEVQTSFGSRIRIKNLFEFHQRALFEDDLLWEPEVQAALNALLRPGAVFLDVGANLGFFSLLAAKLVGPSGSVHAFEPVPAQHRHLVENISLNHAANVRVNQVAISDRDGTAEIFVSQSWNAGVHSLFPISDAISDQVTTSTLDRYCSDNDVHQADVVKIDVEGAETLVLRGATGLLGSGRRPFIVLEADDSHARRAGSSLQQVEEILKAAGYDVSQLLGGGGVCATRWPPRAASNWFASPSERRSDLPAQLSTRA
jgi:FkbM family methyltransferase